MPWIATAMITYMIAMTLVGDGLQSVSLASAYNYHMSLLALSSRWCHVAVDMSLCQLFFLAQEGYFARK